MFITFPHELLFVCVHFPAVSMTITIVIVVIESVTLVGIPFAIAICCCLNKTETGACRYIVLRP